MDKPRRAQTKFAQLLSEIKAVAARIGEVDAKVGRIDTHIMNSRGVIITTIIGAALGIVGLSYAAVQIWRYYTLAM